MEEEHPNKFPRRRYRNLIILPNHSMRDLSGQPVGPDSSSLHAWASNKADAAITVQSLSFYLPTPNLNPTTLCGCTPAGAKTTFRFSAHGSYTADTTIGAHFTGNAAVPEICQIAPNRTVALYFNGIDGGCTG
jgi:hypothetical protein